MTRPVDAREHASQHEASLARVFESLRPRLRRVAYAITGSLAEAEDCVQEAWLRLQRAESDDRQAIREPQAWLTTTVSRLACDALDRAKVRREQYAGNWLPEPLVEEDIALDPASRIALDESLATALLLVLERLSSAERAAFLLHDVFGLSFDEVSDVLGRSPAAVRQLASRARKHIERGQPRFPPTHDEQRRLVTAFATACREGDLQQLVTLFAPDVVWRGDGGGKVKAAVGLLRGADEVARALLAVVQGPPRTVRIVRVNGAPGLVVRDSEGVLGVVSFTVDAGRIVAVDVVRDPDKLSTVFGLELASSSPFPRGRA